MDKQRRNRLVETGRKLRIWIISQGWDMNKFNRKMGAAPSTTSLWLNGWAKPCHPYALMIEHITGGAIDEKMWNHEEESTVK